MTIMSRQARPSTAVVRRRKGFGWLRPETDPEIQNWKEIIVSIESMEPEEEKHEEDEEKKKKKKKDPEIDADYAADGSNSRRGARTALLGGVDTRSPLFSTNLLQPLLEVATLLQDKDRWDESLIFIERGAVIADAHHNKQYVLYFEEAKVTLADVQASRKK